MRKTLTILFGALLLSSASFAFQTAAKPAAAEKKATTEKKAAPAAAPAQTPAQIADAKAKGMVWVNLNSGIYHKDGEFYGKTKSGKFMTEADAMKAGHRAAKEPKPAKKPADKMAPTAAPSTPAKK